MRTHSSKSGRFESKASSAQVLIAEHLQNGGLIGLSNRADVEQFSEQLLELQNIRAQSC